MNTAIPTHSAAWWLYKLRALLISFTISLLFISTLTLVLLHWLYPEWFLFRYDGGWQGLKIVMGVDLILGPVIAFIIFSPNKARHLILLDIVIVGVIQISAFLWGCYALWTQHPLALIYRDDTFNSLVIEDLKDQGTTTDALLPFNTQKPILIYSQPPTNEAAVAETVEMFTKGITPYTRVENFKPIKDHLSEVFANSELLKKALEKESPEALAAFSKKHNYAVDSLRLASATLRTHNVVIVMDEKANILGAIPVSDKFDGVVGMIKAKK